MSIRSACSAIAAVACLLAAPATARADWLRAESERFVVYSDGSERSLRDYVQKLETFDRVMRYRTGFQMDEAPVRKLPIYLVGSRSGLTRVHPGTAPNVVGTYFPSEEDVFAVAIRGENDEVMLHEYGHHFMLGNIPGAYPGWFVEGFAEYYMTARIKDDEVRLGDFSTDRAAWLLNAPWLPLDVLLRARPGEIQRNSHRNTYYPVAWLLTHWFISDPDRLTRLQTYLNAVAEGADPVQAMQTASGMTLDQLRTALRRYMSGPLTVRTLKSQFPAADITVARLPKSANDLLLINQRLKIGVPAGDREALGQEVLRLAARHGDDPLALMAAGHAGLHFGDRPAGERALNRLLEIDPDHVEALQYLAQEKLRQARETDDDDAARASKQQAKAYLARAYAAAQNDYRTLMLLTDLRRGEAGYPNDNDMLTMGLALDRAPQLPGIRFDYAYALAQKDRKNEAIAVLKPLANDPHGGGASTLAEKMIAVLEAGEPLPLAWADAPATPEPEEPAPPTPEPNPAGG